MFKTIFTQLCIARNVSPAFVMKELGYSNSVYSKWSDDTLPRPSTLIKVSEYFGVSVEYLKGEEDDSAVAAKAMGEVMEWLQDNDYEISEDENNMFAIGKNGEYCYLTNADFATESLAIKKVAEEGFELAMLDWERRNFQTCYELSEEEAFLIKTYRKTGTEGRARIHQLLLNISDEEEKKSTSKDTKAIG